MVDARIEAEFALNEAAFLFASGNADDPAAFDPGNLADHRTDRARGRSDDDGLSGLRFSDIQQPVTRFLRPARREFPHRDLFLAGLFTARIDSQVLQHIPAADGGRAGREARAGHGGHSRLLPFAFG